MQKVPVPGMSKDGMEKHELEIIGLKHPHEQLSAVRLDLLDHHLFHSFTDDSCERRVFFLPFEPHSFALCGPRLFVGFP